MRKFFMLTVGVLLAAGAMVAQGHDNTRERDSRDTLTFASDVRVGSHVLPAGEDRVVCSRQEIAFTQTSGEKATFKVLCQGKEMPETRKDSQVYTSLGPDGVRVMDKLLLKGSNVEHVFTGAHWPSDQLPVNQLRVIR